MPAYPWDAIGAASPTIQSSSSWSGSGAFDSKAYPAQTVATTVKPGYPFPTSIQFPDTLHSISHPKPQPASQNSSTLRPSVLTPNTDSLTSLNAAQASSVGRPTSSRLVATSISSSTSSSAEQSSCTNSARFTIDVRSDAMSR